MVKRSYKPSDEPPDGLSYEDFDDATWDADAEIDAINLDALDDEIIEEAGPAPGQPDPAEVSLLETIDHLRDESTPPAVDDEPAPEPALAETLSSVEEVLPSEVGECEPEDAPPAAEPATELTPAEAVLVAPDETPAVDVSTVEVSPTAEMAELEAPPEPEPAPEIYCALLPLPSDLHAQVVKLRKLGKITSMPPPGIALTPPFLTHERPAVEAALTEWTRAHLPFQLEIISVMAKVIGAQQYIAAWALEPEEELLDAQHELRQALADLILPVPGAAGTFNAWLPVGDHVAAARYPHIIGQMQRDFEPFVWHANDLHLVRQGEPWETLKTFD